MRPFRDKRDEAIRQYCGANYSEDTDIHKVPLNLIELAVGIYTQLLVGDPQVLVTTSRRQLKKGAVVLELALNHLLKEILFKDSLEAVAKDAMFSPFGVAKIGLNASKTVELGGVYHDVGQPYADCVSFDDYVIDMAAHSFQSAQFEGNRYRLTMREMKDSGLFKNLGKIKPTDPKTNNEDGIPKTSTVSRGKEQITEYMPGVDLWDIYLPYEQMVITVPDEQEDLIVRAVNWDGPEGGCYRKLVFNHVPDQIMGLPPTSLMLDLHLMANTLIRKLRNQAERQKIVTGYAGTAVDDAGRVQQAKDGHMLRMDHPDRVKEFALGGIDQRNLAFVVALKDFFSYFSGNLDLLGGLGPQSGTATQDELLIRSASRRLTSMQNKVSGFVSEVVRDLAWYLWTDPLIEMPLVKRIDAGAAQFEIPMRFSPEDREGDILDYNVDINPYSVQSQTPGQKFSMLMQTFGQVLAPMAPLLQQQGIIVDMKAFLKLLAKYGNMEDDMSEILKYKGSEEGPADEQTTSSPTSHRTYERVNRPGSTNRGKDQVLMNNLLGKSMQPAEQEAAMRPTG